MAVLDAQNRIVCGNHIMRQAGAVEGALTKPDLRAAVDATDDWIDSRQGQYNTALPEPFKSTATQAQKTLLFCYVAMRRAGLLRAEED